MDSAGASHTLAVDARGVAAFAALPEGPGELRVTADAFQSYSGPIALKKGANAFSLQLPLANITAEIVVRQDEADRQGNSFVSTLDERQIAELPDDPDELEQMLQQMAGPGAVMRINGFRGGQMPPKNQIRQIRFRMNSYAAENHDAGGFGIDIFTKPGADAWRGMSSFGFRDESLNARNAFAPRLGPEQYRRVGINFNGPLVKNKTSLAVSTDGNFSYESKTINAQTPDQSISAQVRRPSDISNVVVRVEHALTAKQSLMVEVQHHDDERRNLGVGDYDLPSRAYHRDGDETVVRGSLNGLVAPKVANELKIQYSGNTTTTGSLSAAPAVIVLQAFSTGGAGQQSDRTTHAFEVDDNVDFSFSKKHAVRAGLQLESYWYDSLDLQNANGTFTFASNNAYELGLANTYQQRQGGTPINFAQYQLGVYAQDDWTISKKLSLSLGVRQELQNTLGDRLNLAPRVGFTWAPSKWTVRGGWGIFNDWYDSSVYEQTLLVNGVNQSDLVVLRPGYPDPVQRCHRQCAAAQPCCGRLWPDDAAPVAGIRRGRTELGRSACADQLHGAAEPVAAAIGQHECASVADRPAAERGPRHRHDGREHWPPRGRSAAGQRQLVATAAAPAVRSQLHPVVHEELRRLGAVAAVEQPQSRSRLRAFTPGCEAPAIRNRELWTSAEDADVHHVAVRIRAAVQHHHRP